MITRPVPGASGPGKTIPRKRASTFCSGWCRERATIRPRGRAVSADRLQKLDANQMDFAGFLLPLHSCLDRRHSGWHQTGGDDRRGGNCKRDDVVDGERPGTNHERPYTADIQGFTKLDELLPMSVPPADEERHLKMDPMEATPVVVRLGYLLLHNVFSNAHWYPSISTHFDCPFSCKFSTPRRAFCKRPIFIWMPMWQKVTHAVSPLKCSGLMQFISTYVQTLGRFYH